MRNPFLPFAFLALVAFARADDITLTDGTILKEARIVSHDADSVMIVYSAGVTKVKMDKMPPEIRKVLALEASTPPPVPPSPPPASSAPVPAADPSAPPPPLPPLTLSPEQASKLRRAIVKASVEASGRVQKVLADGILITLFTVTTTQTEVPHSKAVNINADGLGHTPVYETQTWTTTETHETRQSLGRCFVACNTEGLVDDQLWSGTVCRIGTYTYGGPDLPSTLAKYTNSAQIAFDYYADPKHL